MSSPVSYAAYQDATGIVDRMCRKAIATAVTHPAALGRETYTAQGVPFTVQAAYHKGKVRVSWEIGNPNQYGWEDIVMAVARHIDATCKRY